MEPISALVAILVGVLSCFYGYRLFKVVLALWGFAIGAALAAAAAMTMTENDVAVLVAGIVGGLIGASIFAVAFKVALFAFGASFGVLVSGAFSVAAQAEPNIVALLVPALIGGILALVLQKPVVVIATAYGGAASAAMGALYLLAGYGPKTVVQDTQLLGKIVYGALAAWGVLGLVGAVVQYRVTGKAPAPPPPDKAADQ